MTSYSAYTKVNQEFQTFEDAMQYLNGYEGTEGKAATAVSILTEESSFGAQGELVDGVPGDTEATNQAFVVQVKHIIPGGAFTISYVVEYTEEEVENGEPEDADDTGYGVEEPVEEVDAEPGEGSEVDSDVPSAGAGAEPANSLD